MPEMIHLGVKRTWAGAAPGVLDGLTPGMVTAAQFQWLAAMAKGVPKRLPPFVVCTAAPGAFQPGDATKPWLEHPGCIKGLEPVSRLLKEVTADPAFAGCGFVYVVPLVTDRAI